MTSNTTQLPVLNTTTLSTGEVLDPNSAAQLLLASLATPTEQPTTLQPYENVQGTNPEFVPQAGKVRGRSVAEHLRNYGASDGATLTEVARQEVASLRANNKYANTSSDHPFFTTDQLESTNPLISVPANLANMSMAVAATANNIGRTLATVPDQMEASFLVRGIPQNIRQAYDDFNFNRKTRLSVSNEINTIDAQLKLDPNNQELLVKRANAVKTLQDTINMADDSVKELQAKNPNTGNTYQEDLDKASEMRKQVLFERGYEEDGRTPNELNTREWYNQRAMTDIQESVKADVDSQLSRMNQRQKDQLSFWEKFSLNAGSALDAATNNLTAIPTLVAESLPYFVAPAVGAASAYADQSAKSMNQFIADNGRLPTDSELREMSTYDAAYAGLNFLGDKAVSKPLDIALGGAGRTATGSAIGSAGRIAAPFTTEFVAEGAQSAIEDNLGSLGEADPTAAGIGAALGGLAGGVVGTPGALADVAFPTNANEDDTASLPIEALTDPKSKDYNPTAGAQRFIFAYDQAKTEEDRTYALEQFEQFKSNNEDLIVGNKKLLKDYEAFQSGAIQQNEAKLEELLANPELDEDDRTYFQEVFAKRRKELENANNMIGNDIEEFKTHISNLEKEQVNIDALYERLNKTRTAKSDPVYAEFITLTDSHINAQTVSRAMTLANDSTNSLTPEQRTTLRKLGDAVVAANQKKNLQIVAEDVAEGSKGYRGLKQYLEQWNAAKRSGNGATQSKLYSDITSFGSSHANKAAAFEQAYANTPKGSYSIVQRASNGEWIVSEPDVGMVDSTEVPGLTENGGAVIHSGSAKLVEAVRGESNAINKVIDYMDSTKVVTPSTPVKDEFQEAMDAYQNKDREIRRKRQEAKKPVVEDAPIIIEGLDTPTAPETTSVEDLPNTEPNPIEIPVEPTEEDVDIGTANLSTDNENITAESPTVEDEGTVDESPVTEEVTSSLIKGDKETNKNLATERNATESTGYQEADLVAASFTQVKSTYLAANTDFLSWLKESLLENLEALLGDVTEKQYNTVVSFAKFTDKFSKVIKGYLTYKGANNKFKYRDYLQYLIDETGDVEENVKTAISYAAFTWLAENANKRYRDMESVARLLGLPDTTQIPYNTWKEFSESGNYSSEVIKSLGERAYTALGMKLDKGVTQTRKDKLQNAFGAMAYMALLDQGLIEEGSYTIGELNKFVVDTGGTTRVIAEGTMDAKVYFARPVWKDGEPIKAVSAISDAVKGSKGVLTDLFGVSSDKRYPSTTPINGFYQKTISSTGTAIPADLVVKVKKMQATPYAVNESMVSAIESLMGINEDALLKMLGYVPEEELENKHISTVLSQKAINEAVVRSLSNSMEYLQELERNEDGTYVDLYMPLKVWEVNRIGIDNTVLNEQGDKLHRALVGIKDHKVTIDIDTAFNADGTITPYGYYLLAIGSNIEEAPLSIGTTPDKITAGQYIPSLLDYLNTSPVVANGVKAMRDLRNGQMPDVRAISEAVQEFGMNSLSLMALDSLVDYFDAKESKGQLTTSMAFESDGVTNGLIISVLAYGGHSDSLLAAGGLYQFSDTGISNNVTYRALGGKDVYQQIGAAQDFHYVDIVKSILSGAKAWGSKYRNYLGALSTALTFFDPNFGKRKGAKVATTPFVYGSSFGAIKRAMTYRLIDGIYAAIEKAVDDKEALSVVNDNLKAITDTLGAFGHKVGTINLLDMTKSELLDATFDKAFIDGLLAVDGDLRGVATSRALKQVAGSLIESRTRLTAVANGGAAIYAKLYEAMYAKVEEELQDELPTRHMKVKGEMQFVQLEPMSAEQEALVQERLKPYNSTIKSANSVFKGKNVEDAAHRTYEFVNEKSYEYTSEHTFAKAPFKGARKNINTSVTKRSISPKGVGISALVIQAMDAFVSATTASSVPVTGHHDANGGSVVDAVKMAKTQNQAFWDSQSRYHLSSESLNALLKPLQGLISSDLFTEEEIVQILDDVFQDEKDGVITKTGLGLLSIVSEAFNDDIAKLRKMTQIKWVNQYGTEGGEYEVTNKDRSLLLKEISKLEVAKEKAIAEFMKFAPYMKWDQTLNPAKKEVVNKSPLQEVTSANLNKVSKIGDYLDGVIAAIQNNKQMGSIKDLTTEFIKAGLGADTNVVIVDEHTISLPFKSSFELSDFIKSDYKGATFIENGKVYIVMKESAIGSELVLHEYVHAVTMQATQSNSPKAKKFLEELDAIRLIALQSFESSKGSMDERTQKVFAYGLKNNDEFLATGFTSKVFQDFLQQVTVPKVTNRKFETDSVFTKFVNLIGSYFGLTAKSNNALAGLLFNGVGLMSINNEPMNQGLSFLGSIDAAEDSVNSLSSEELFNALPNTNDSDFNTYLKNTFNDVLKSSHDLLERMGFTNVDRASRWADMVQQGKTPFTSDLVAKGFKLSAQERFVVESIEVSLRAALANGYNTPIYREMIRAYESARTQLSVTDFHDGTWANATGDEKALAQSKYNALFESHAVGKRSDYLSKFVAASIGSKEVNTLMQKVEVKLPEKFKGNYFDRLTLMISSLMNWVNGYLTKTLRMDSVAGKLPTLAEQLIDINYKSKVSVFDTVFETMNAVQQTLNDKGKLVGNKGANLLEGINSSKRASIRGVNKTVQSILRGTFMNDINTVREWRNYWHTGENSFGWANELLTEFAEPSKMRLAMSKLIRTHNMLQGERKRMIDVTKANLLELFDNKLSKDSRELITKVFLRTDVQVLLKEYGIKGIQEFLSTPSKRDVELAKLTKTILGFENAELMLVRAKDLAHYQVSGEGRTGLAKNATAIAKNVGTSKYLDVTVNSLVQALEAYTALTALSYLEESDQKNGANLIELYTKPMDSVLRYHMSIAKEAKQTLFADSSNSLISGYVPDISNPHREIRIATSEEEVAALLKFGFVVVTKLKDDPNDPYSSDSRTLMMTEESTRERFVTGAISLTNTAVKGTSVFKAGKEDPKTVYQTLSQARKVTEQALMAKAANYASYDPRKEKNAMIPVYRNDGFIKDYRYEMNNKVRDQLLERNNDFASLLGAYVGSTFDKAHTPTHNKQVIDLLLEDDVNAEKDRKAFVEISATSSNPEFVEIWAMLPDSTRAYIRGKTGGDALLVRKEILRGIFGFEKLTVGNMFDKAPELRGVLEGFAVGMAEAFLGDKAKVRTMSAERAIQEVMDAIKNIIVIRNVSTLIGNQTTNFSILMARGINPKDIVEKSLLALRSGTQYRKDMARKVSIERQLLAGVGNRVQLENELIRVNDSLDRNPLKEFIAAGMLPTIVEDISLDQEEYTYKSKLLNQWDENTAFIPDGVKTAVKWATVSQGTPLYEFLSNATQFSDFMAKFVIFDQVVNKEGGTIDEGVDLADKLFIAYDVPTSPQLQYLNDMGLVMFTKYYIRIQRAMFYLLKNYPTSTLAQTALASMGNYAGALDPIMLGGIGNPFTGSVLGLPSALVEPIPIKLMLGML